MGSILTEVPQTSQKFLGTSYNLLTNNCNHFTSYLCEQLTGKPAPAWINRAASIGLAVPCVVPKEWISPPDHETADGELVEDDMDDDDDEHAAMLKSDQRRRRQEEARLSRRSEDEGQSSATVPSAGRVISRTNTPPVRVVSLKDTSGREIPATERAPMPKR